MHHESRQPSNHSLQLDPVPAIGQLQLIGIHINIVWMQQPTQFHHGSTSRKSSLHCWICGKVITIAASIWISLLTLFYSQTVPSIDLFWRISLTNLWNHNERVTTIHHLPPIIFNNKTYNLIHRTTIHTWIQLNDTINSEACSPRIYHRRAQTLDFPRPMILLPIPWLWLQNRRTRPMPPTNR